MTNNIPEAPFLKEFIKVTHDMWLKGWAERNGGNASYRLTTEEIAEYLDPGRASAPQPLFKKLPELAGEAFLLTGTGKYFRNVILNPEVNLGIIRIDEQGENYHLCWGLTDGTAPTSELPSHLLTHAVRKEITGGKNQVVLHTHATNLIALSFVLKPDTRILTKALWEMISECIIVFPEGIGVLPWMLPGSAEIGEATAELMKTHALVLWLCHGVFGTGNTLDEAFGLIDTAEKAAEILVKVLSMGGAKQKITEAQLKSLAQAFNVRPLAGIL